MEPTVSSQQEFDSNSFDPPVSSPPGVQQHSADLLYSLSQWGDSSCVSVGTGALDPHNTKINWLLRMTDLFTEAKSFFLCLICQSSHQDWE